MECELDVRNLPSSNERTHANTTKLEKGDLIDANSPLRHLEFKSPFRCFQLKQSFIETKHLQLTLTCQGSFFGVVGTSDHPVEHPAYVPPPTTRET